MSDKYFNIHNPNQVVTITSMHDSFYQLSDGNMIKKESFDSKYQPLLENFEQEYIPENKIPSYNSNKIDPNSFFNSTSLSTTDIEKIQKTDPSSVPNIPDGVERSEIKVNTTDQTSKRTQPINMNEPLVKRVDEQVIPNNTKTDVSQYKVYDDDEEAYEDFIKNSGITKEQPKPIIPKKEIDPMIDINLLYDDELIAFGKVEADTRRNKRMSKLNPSSQQNTNLNDVQQESQTGNSIPGDQTPSIDPVNLMLSTFKRNHEVIFNFEFKDKIANPDFLKMMMENMDGDIVGYYKKMIVKNIMNNLNVIENVVEKELKSILLDEEVIEKIKPVKQKRVIPTVPKEERSQIQEGTTLYMIPSKKPRTKKVQDNKTNK